MTKITLYQLPISAPCRSVQMLCDVMGLELENKTCDLMKGEHLKPEYLNINPHHTIPTMVDQDGFALHESRAIMTYLVDKYAPNSSLYPTDLKKRALVDQALQFDGTSLYPAYGFVVYPSMRFSKPLDRNMAKSLDDKLILFNDDLGRTPYIAGDELTVADLALLATWTTIDSIGIWKTDHLTNIHAWVKRIKDSGKIKNWDSLVVSTSKMYGDWMKEKIVM